MNADTIAQMKDKVILVNTSRGALIKTEDLIAGIRSRKFFGVGLDVYEEETGNVFVLCEFEICNNSDTEIAVSSMLSFEAYCDDYTCSGSFSALLEKGDKNQLDGTVAAGKKFKGVVGYEVPEDWKELEIRYTPDYWNGNDIVFIANK